jgi:hypothetical protein
VSKQCFNTLKGVGSLPFIKQNGFILVFNSRIYFQKIRACWDVVNLKVLCSKFREVS